MSVKKFKFVSPGVFVNEIDNSQLTKQGDDIGPVIIGTALRGPSMVPTRIESFSDFVETFGEPLSGSEGSDVWREGNKLAPTYAAYAAQAYLRNASPVTFVRLLGEAHPDGSDKAGWSITDPSTAFDAAGDGAAGAYGLFISNGGSAAVAAKGSVEFNTVVIANAGFNVTYDGGSAVTEASGTHPAFSIDVSSNNAGNDTLTMTHFDGDTSSLVLGDGAGKQVVGGAAAVADQRNNLVSYINTTFPELEAIGDSVDVSKLYVREKARVKVAGAGSVNVAFIAGANNLTVVEGSSSAFCNFSGGVAAQVFSAGAYAGVAETGASTISLAKAMESAGISPFHSFTGAASVDAQLATQFAALGSFGANTLAVDGTDTTKVVVTSTAEGTAGNSKAIAGSVGTVVGTGTGTSGSASSLTGQTGALAAILYAKSGAISLMGSSALFATPTVSGVGVWMRSDGANNQFKLRVQNTAGSKSDISNKEDISFNFNKNSRLYVRNVLNTNPTLCDANVSGTGKLKAYFLGETFDRHLADVQAGISTAKGAQYACLLPIKGAGNHESNASPAKTPWIISQHNGNPAELDTTSSALLNDGSVESKGIEKLMRLHSLYAGQWERKNLKVAIEDIKAPSDKFNPYGTFSVVVRRVEDSDAAPTIVERFSSCNLNPASADYVGKKIGDMHMVWDDDERRYQAHGQFENQSRFLRVEVSSSVESGLADARMLPFGFLGPKKKKDIVFTNAATPTLEIGGVATDFLMDAEDSELKFHSASASSAGSAWAAADEKIVIGPATDGATTRSTADFSVTLKFPSMALRTTSADSTLSSPRDANFGITTSERGSDSIFDESYMDLAGYCGFGTPVGGDDATAVGANDEHQFIFTLDDIRYPYTIAEGGGNTDANAPAVTSKPKNFIWEAGSRASAGAHSVASITGYTPASGIPGGFEAILDKGIQSFTLPLLGGHDGIDVFQVQPFSYHASASSNTALASADSSALSHYALNSLKKAVDTVADPEVVDMNLLAAPGMTHPSITNHMVSVCESRGDALAVIDLDNDYMPTGMDVSKSEADRMPNVDQAITSLRERSLNSSYGCAFFPWVQIADTMSGRVLWAPPSIAALGTMASSSRKSELWFAPAGFTRGGLTDGAAGVPVSSVRLRLNSKERDKLYEANINPIAQFPAEGIVIFGQKTLQVTPSALDRINVRRLMIFLKKSISRMAKTVLFDQNVESTWSRFTSQADPFLASVKSRFGLSEYRIILDKTTTTAELVDRNIMYAKILLKPTRAIEYIAIDFVITDSGASFDD